MCVCVCICAWSMRCLYSQIGNYLPLSTNQCSMFKCFSCLRCFSVNFLLILYRSISVTENSMPAIFYLSRLMWKSVLTFRFCEFTYTAENPDDFSARQTCGMLEIQSLCSTEIDVKLFLKNGFEGFSHCQNASTKNLEHVRKNHVPCNRTLSTAFKQVMSVKKIDMKRQKFTLSYKTIKCIYM